MALNYVEFVPCAGLPDRVLFGFFLCINNEPIASNAPTARKSFFRTLREPPHRRNVGGNHGGWPRRAAQGSDLASRETRDPLRRQVPHRGFCALELREFRHPPDLHPHAVQGAVSHSARAARLELPAR